MKRLVFIVLAALLPVLASAQAGSIDKVINKYSGKEDVTVVNISPDLFQLISDLEIKEIKDAEFPVDKLSAVKILAIENEEILANNNFYDEVMSNLNTDGFMEVISVREADEDVRIWMKTQGKQIREFLLVVSSPDEGVVVYIEGDFNLSDIEGMAESFGGMEALEQLGDLEIN